MNAIRFAGLWLRLRLVLLRAGPVTLAAIALLLLSLGSLATLVHALVRERQAHVVLEAQQARAVQDAGPGEPAAVAPIPLAPRDNLDAFYGALGQRRYVEQQVKTLFGLAAKSGLVLSQGEYKSARDRNARVGTYQVNLPVKGSYAAVWQFALAALRTIPFAALDDVSFRRENIGEPVVEARLRFTLYLADERMVDERTAGERVTAAGPGR
jgi:hypothetical protein